MNFANFCWIRFLSLYFGWCAKPINTKYTEVSFWKFLNYISKKDQIEHTINTIILHEFYSTCIDVWMYFDKRECYMCCVFNGKHFVYLHWYDFSPFQSYYCGLSVENRYVWIYWFVWMIQFIFRSEYPTCTCSCCLVNPQICCEIL